MDNNLIISVQDLSISFQTEDALVNAVKNISFDLHKGEILGIVGESGSGKSVSSLAILGLLDKRVTNYPSGKIIYTKEGKEVDLLEMSEDDYLKERGCNFSMIFQEPMTSLNPVYTCGDQVVESLRTHLGMTNHQAKARTIELFNEVELPRPEKIFDSYPHQISGGQKQRVMIAIAICCEPKLLIADEPTTALDVTVQKEIVELLKKLRDKNRMSIIFISHDLSLVANVSDTIAVMRKGELLEVGAAKQIFTNPKHPYTKGLIHCKPQLDTNFKKLPTVDEFFEIGENKELIEKHPDFAKFGTLTKTVENKEILIELKHLNTWYATEKNIFGKVKNYVKAVNDVSIKLYKGQTLGLVGESGCGKSTIGNTIMGITPAFSGEIIYEGRDILKQSKSEWVSFRKKAQLIFQDPYSSLNPRKTIEQIIIEPMMVNNKERVEKAIELLETVGLQKEHLTRLPHEFSGGQRQRICIARTLALEPEIIICDESVSALDVSVQAQVLNLLNDLKERFQFTYIFISHDLSVVKFMADQLVVMKDGKIEEQGTGEEIYKNPQKEYTKKLIEAIPVVRF
jgi:peptide/nickel transport system ATP-binding protein